MKYQPSLWDIVIEYFKQKENTFYPPPLINSTENFSNMTQALLKNNFSSELQENLNLIEC